MNVIPKIHIYRSLQQRDRQLAPPARGHPSSYAPGTPPALRGPLVRKPFSPAVPSAPGACPALPGDAAVRKHAPASARKSGFGCVRPSHPPPAPGNEGLKRRSSHPCLALPCRPQSLLPREPEPTVWRTGRRSAKALTFQMFLWPQKCVCSPPLAPSLTGISPSWWSGTRGWWLAGSPRSG